MNDMTIGGLCCTFKCHEYFTLRISHRSKIITYFKFNKHWRFPIVLVTWNAEYEFHHENALRTRNHHHLQGQSLYNIRISESEWKLQTHEHWTCCTRISQITLWEPWHVLLPAAFWSRSFWVTQVGQSEAYGPRPVPITIEKNIKESRLQHHVFNENNNVEKRE